MKRLLLALATGWMLLAAQTWASAPAGEALSAEDCRDIRAVVEAQLDAFRQDDAARAFGYASRGIRATFDTPDAFMHMVRTAYAVVYRPRSVAFEPPVIVAGEVLQPVRMTDAQGRAWLAIYPMQRHPDGSWRVNGCQLAQLPGEPT